MATDSKRMRRLSFRSAQRCEDAKEDICRCRCGGMFHGARRGSVGALPYGDPHSLEKKCSLCKGGGWRSGKKCPRCKGSGIIKPKAVKVAEAEADLLT